MFRICGVSRQDKRSLHPITLTASSSTRLAFIVVVILLAQQSPYLLQILGMASLIGSMPVLINKDNALQLVAGKRRLVRQGATIITWTSLGENWYPVALNCPHVGAGKKCRSQAWTNPGQK